MKNKINKKFTPFQRYKLRIEVRIQQLELQDKDINHRLSQAERWELVYLHEVIKDLDENVLDDEEIFAKECFDAGFDAAGFDAREEDFDTFYKQYSKQVEV